MDAHTTHTVLIVDDNDDFRVTLAELLDIEGFQVAVASSAEDALRYFRQGDRPCVVLLDLRMPGMDGWALYDQMRRQPDLATVPVVMVSGYAHQAKLAYERGVSHFLAKPAEPEALIGAVERHCLRRRKA